METIQKQLSTDLDYFSKKLIEMHPNPFKYIKKKGFLSYIDELKTTFKDPGLEEVGIGLMKLIAKLKDGHTELGVSYAVLGPLNYPFKFKYIKDGYYVVSASEEYKQYLGSQLTGINNKLMSEIEDLLTAIIPIENETSLKYYLPTKLIEPNLLNYFGITKANHAKFVLQKEENKSVVEVAAIDYSKTELLDINTTIKELDITLNKKKEYWIKSIPMLDTAYLQYNSCSERNDYPMSRVVRDIKSFNAKKLIIDLRNNKGGDSEILNPLLDYIKKNETRIKTFTLVGADTYSSAIINLLDISKLPNTISVGEIPHGNPTHYGEVESFELPNSRLKIFTSTKIFTFKGYELGESFKPDYIVPHIPKELFRGKDTQFEYLRRNLL